MINRLNLFLTYLSRFWRWRYYFPLTWVGALVAGMGYWVSFHYAKDQFDYILYASGLVTMGIVGLSVCSVILVFLGISLHLRRHREEKNPQLETGLMGTTGFQLPRWRGVPLIHLRLQWEDPKAIEVLLKPRANHLEEWIRPLQRGETRHRIRRILISDIFGFANLGLVHQSIMPLKVLPSRARITAHITHRFLGGDAISYPSGPAEGERLEMRRYTHGDPLRYILWKAFARTRQLLVRTPEQAITPLPSVAAYFVAGPEDEPTASAARYFIEEGLLGQDFIFIAAGSPQPTGDPAEAINQLVASINYRKQGAANLPRFLAQLDNVRRQHCILFVPPVPGKWISVVESVAKNIAHALVITSVDMVPLSQGLPPWRSFLFADSKRIFPITAWRLLGDVVHRLSACGLEIKVLHRPSGDFLSQLQLNTLKPPKAQGAIG